MRLHIFTLAILACGSLLAQAPPVPTNYQGLYNYLNSQITNFDKAVNKGWNGSSYPYLNAPQLEAASSSEYTELLETSYSVAVGAQIVELKALGANAVTLQIFCPILDQDFYTYIGDPALYQQFVTYYQQLVQYIHSLGMKVVVEASLYKPLTGTNTSQFQSYLGTLSWTDYMNERAANALAVAQLVQPDYITVLTESDSEETVSGQTNLGTPAGVTELVQTILTTLQNAGVTNIQIGAGVGTWTTDYMDYVQALAALPMNFVDMHIYQINDSDFLNALTAAATIEAAGLQVGISECWDMKITDSELSNPDYTTIFGRDPFSFWAPLDTSFLEAIVNFAKYKQLAFISPFWVHYFFAYLNFATYGSLPAATVLTDSYTAASNANLVGAFTSTGLAWETQNIPPDTTPPATPAAPTASNIQLTSLLLQWTTDYDNVGVSAYYLYRNGSLLATTSLLTYGDSGLVPGETYSYNLLATDASGNVSPASPALMVETLMNQTITFGPLSNQTLGTAPFPVSATASSGLPVTFTSNTISVCTVSGNTVTLVSLGTCTIKASQGGNAAYTAATPVKRSFLVSGAPTSVVLSANPIPATFGTVVALSATVSPSSATGSVTFYDGATILGIAPVSSGIAAFNTLFLPSGTGSLTAFYGGSSTYASSLSIPLAETVNAGPADTLSAASGSPFAVGNQPVSVAIADFTGDGFADLAVVNSLDNTVTVLLGNGKGAFGPSTGSPFGVGNQPVSVAIADFNGDGNPDLVVANGQDGTVTVLLGNGMGQFVASAKSPFTVGTTPVSVAVADFNGDGIADLAVANSGSNDVTVLLGDGKGDFLPAVKSPFLVGNVPSFIVAADFNADENVDLAVANDSDGTVTVLLGNGSAGFTASSGGPFGVGTQPVSLAVSDFNADGNLDLAVANAGSGNVTVLLGNGSGGFAASGGSPFTTGTLPTAVVVGDFNGDGYPDLAVANEGSANNVMVLLGNGHGSFQPEPSSPFTAGVNPQSMAVGNFNGDGKTDLAVANSGGGNVTILLGADVATQLAMNRQPAAGTVGSPIGTVAVHLEDAAGNLVYSPAANVTISSTPAGVAGTLTVKSVDGVATFTGLVFSSAVSYTLTASSPGLASATSSAIQIAPASQTITFGALPSKVYGTAPFTVHATASSGLTVSFASTTMTQCTVSGTTVTLVAVGECTIQASQTGNANYLAANPVNQNFQVTQASQTITFGALANKVYRAAPFAVSATASSGLAVTFYSATLSVCTVSGDTVTLIAAGTCTIQAHQAGNTDYAKATPVSQSFQVMQASQTINFPALSDARYGESPFVVGATASSGLAVSFASLTTTVCTMSRDTVTLVGTGTCTLQATQTGNPDWLAATPVSQSFSVGRDTQTITFGPLSNKTLGTVPFNIQATASSGLAISFFSQTKTVCTVSGDTVTLAVKGTCTIQAHQEGNADYLAATPVSQSFQVTAAP